MGYPSKSLNAPSRLASMGMTPEESPVRVMQIKNRSLLKKCEVHFPGGQRVNFYASVDVHGGSWMYAMYRDENLIDHALSADEANKRLLHEARKYAYMNAGGKRVEISFAG